MNLTYSFWRVFNSLTQHETHVSFSCCSANPTFVPSTADADEEDDLEDDNEDGNDLYIF